MSKQHYSAYRNPKHDAVLEVACTRDQLAAMNRQAAREDHNLSDWARLALLKRLPKRRTKPPESAATGDADLGMTGGHDAAR